MTISIKDYKYVFDIRKGPGAGLSIYKKESESEDIFVCIIYGELAEYVAEINRFRISYEWLYGVETERTKFLERNIKGFRSWNENANRRISDQQLYIEELEEELENMKIALGEMAYNVKRKKNRLTRSSKTIQRLQNKLRYEKNR